MGNVTFYIGAGASCQALPLVSQIPDRLQGCIEFLKRSDLRLSGGQLTDCYGVKKSLDECQDVLIYDLEWLKAESARHATIDTFAKKLYIKHEIDDLRRLKSALTAFFTIEQFRETNVDPRYDAFFSSILERSYLLPKQIRIVSWNYDQQLEIALSEYSDTKRIGLNSQHLSQIAKGQAIYDDADYKCFKMNGTADYEDGFGSNSNQEGVPSSDLNLVNYVVNNHFTAISKNGLKTLMSFAWEEVSKKDYKCIDIVDAAMKGVKSSDILVVIGYSFPFFNRQVDRKIINSMPLKKVYIQDINATSIIERFQAIRPDFDRASITPIRKNMDQFFIPHEL